MKQILIVFTLCSIAFGAENKKVDVKQAFADFQVSPDIISKAPDKLLELKYTKSNKIVEPGKEIAPKNVKDAPEVNFEADADEFYTLIMTDPDAPSRINPIRREFQHWLVVNIPGSDVTKGETISEYVGSGPPKDTGFHRYAFVVYKQPGQFKFEEPKRSKTDGNRGLFNTEKFVQKYKLEGPIAGNFFQAQYDDSVDEIHKQLGIGQKKN